jgi:hypothetical protein
VQFQWENLISPNLYLTGDIRENVRYVDGRKVQYLKVTLKAHKHKDKPDRMARSAGVFEVIKNR